VVVTARGEDSWQGTEARDLDGFLADYCSERQTLSRIVHAVCALCGNGAFHVLVDDAEGVAGRVCLRCGDRRWMLDSDAHAEHARPVEAACPCGGEVFDVAVGFTIGAGGLVSYVHLALRCLTDGTMGVYADWPQDSEPPPDLLSRV
jgi:hypothetical protein